jgi:hypothetical protein
MTQMQGDAHNTNLRAAGSESDEAAEGVLNTLPIESCCLTTQSLRAAVSGSP